MFLGEPKTCLACLCMGFTLSAPVYKNCADLDDVNVEAAEILNQACP